MAGFASELIRAGDFHALEVRSRVLMEPGRLRCLRRWRLKLLEMLVKQMEVREREPDFFCATQWLSPHRLDFQFPSGEPIDERGWLISAHGIGSLNLQVGILLLDGMTKSGCRSNRLVHQGTAACLDLRVAEYFVHRKTALCDGQPVERNIPDELAPTFGCQIIYDPRVDIALAECSRRARVFE